MTAAVRRPSASGRAPKSVRISQEAGAAAFVLCKALAALQLVLALYVVPQLVVRPRWPAVLAFAGSLLRPARVSVPALGLDVAVDDLISRDAWANVVGVPLLHVATLVCGNLFFAALYWLRLPAVEACRAGAETGPWHFAREAGAARNAAFWANARSSVIATLLNVALTVPLAALNYDLSVRLGHRADAASFPSTPSVLAHMLFFALAEDCLFYWGHRTLHSSAALYARVHKQHHAWVQSSAIAAEATHPLEFVICNVVPFAAGPLLSGAHLSLLYLWLTWRVTETVAHHSGYELPTDMFAILPFQGDARAHDLHHARGGAVGGKSGNFGSFSKFWDTVMGTVIPDPTLTEVAH
jgi:hypothetical protein